MDISWSSTELGKVAPAKSNTMPAENEVVWNLSLDEIESTTGRVLRKTHCKVSELGSAKCSFDARHVLYSKLRPYLNKVVIPDEQGVGTSELIPLLPNPEKLDREYLAYYLRSPYFLDFANTNTRGANLPRISMRELWQHRITSPESVEEQRRIVVRIKECMDRVDEIEKLRASQIEDVLLVSDAILDSLVVKTWPVCSLDSLISDIRNGWSGKQSANAPEIGVLRLSCVHDRKINTSDVKIQKVNESVAQPFYLQAGDLFVVRGNGSPHLVGRSAIAKQDDQNVIFNDLLIRIRINENAVPSFINLVLNTRQVRDQILGTAKTAAGIWKINQTGIKKLRLPCPSKELQDNFVERATSALDGCAGISSIVHDGSLHKIRGSILYKAFAGEL